MSTLSLGQRKRVDLRCALFDAPWLLVLDEPSSGLDAAGVNALQALIRQRREQGLGAIIATNDATFERELEGHALHLADGALLAA